MAGRTGASPGRPRASGIATEDPREEIIQVATRLFAERGYERTSMTMLAEACGMKQSSLYYWFANKREVLRATAASNRQSVGAAEALGSIEAATPAKLYRVLYEDGVAICEAPFDYNEIERLAAEHPDDLASFWDDYRALFTFIAGLIRDGVEQGALILGGSETPEWAAALHANEGMQKAYRYGSGDIAAQYPPVEAAEGAGDADRIRAFARRTASATVHSLLVDRAALADVESDALALDLAARSGGAVGGAHGLRD
jgi:AcrR family transcriptional regulator